ncbi:MAG: DUF1289 domain-containing protein [Burkholderiales bacterium]|nr:DUF1289 domain-containing protein [Burkholderiales bacterium]
MRVAANPPVGGITPALPVASPCIGICRLDEGGAKCVGCLRTLEEIAAWSRMDDAARKQVWAAIRRRAQAGG